MKKLNFKAAFDVYAEVVGPEVVKAARYVVYEIPHIMQVLVILAVLFTPWYISLPIIVIALSDFFYGNRTLFKKRKDEVQIEDVVHPTAELDEKNEK